MSEKWRTALATLLLVWSADCPAQFVRTKADWDRADLQTRRLAPSEFKQLPTNLIRDLQQRGCTVPQEHFTKEPHNVIRGEFARSGQADWAVLCSINRVSTILVYWGGSENQPAEIGKGEDNGRLQTLGAGVIGYSRLIKPAGAKSISSYYAEFGGMKPPPVDHLGIEDAFVGKASVIHYFYEGKWLALQGAD